jgi:hypothetical protein
MTEKIYLNIYRSGHVLVSALNVCEIKGVVNDGQK